MLQVREGMMRVYAVRLVAAVMALFAILLVGSAISLHQMYPMRLTGTESGDQRHWIAQEEARRKAEVVRDELWLLAVAGLDISGVIFLFAWERRRRSISRLKKELEIASSLNA